MQLRSKSFLFLSPIIALPLLLVGAIAYTELKNISEKHSIQSNLNSLTQISQITQDKILQAEVNARLISNNQTFKQYALLDDDETRYSLMLSPLLSLFKDLQKSLPEYHEIRFILPDGFEDAVSTINNIKNIEEDIGNLDYFKKMKTQHSINTFLIHDENINAVAFLLSNPIVINDPADEGVNPAPKLRGYLTINMQLTFLQKLINQHSRTHPGILVVTDQNNKLLMYPEKYSMISKETINALIDNIATGNNNFVQSDLPYRFDFENLSYIAHGKELADGIKAFAIVAEHELIKEAKHIGNLVLLITLGTIVISALLIFFILQKIILNPIGQLNDAANSIGQGNLGLKIDIEREDELGNLAISLNAMSQNLGSSLEEIHYIAHHDTLTGLPNRVMFNQCMEKLIVKAKENNISVALLFFDLDDFKHFNDTLGHEFGDKLLQQLANRLKQSLRQNKCTSESDLNEYCDLLARLGGDEFVVILNNINSPMDAAAVADRILHSMSKPVELNQQKFQISASIGITVFPEDAENMSELIRHADIAMYHAKDNGKNRYKFYSPEMNASMLKRLAIKSRLKTALQLQQFVLHYQPKVNPHTQQIVGMEALIRWQDPEKGLIYPNDFIDIAEESGLIMPMTEWVISEAANQNMQWQKAGLNKIPVAVNVSSIQFSRHDLVKMVKDSLDNSGLEAQYLELELTESSLLEDSQDAIHILKRLEALGVHVALDDFGTGYSSLSYLEKFPIQILKVDRSFVQTITDTKSNRAIINAIIALGHALDLKIVAEGVDQEIQLEYLADKGCDIIQGYLFSKPLAADQFEKVLKKGKLSISTD